MSKSKSIGQSSKGNSPSDSYQDNTTNGSSSSMSGGDNFDSNQSAQSMNMGTTDDTSMNQSQSSASGSRTASDVEGSSLAFGDPQDVGTTLGDTTAGQSLSQSQDQSQGQDQGSMGGSSDGMMAKASHMASSVLDNQNVKKNLNLVKDKAQNLFSTSRDQLSSTYSHVSDDVKLRGMMVNDNVRANPYAYAAGAFGIGLIVGRALSGKGRSDLDFLVKSVNKINLSSLAGYLGVNMDDKSKSTSTQNEKSSRAQGGSQKKNQARKIG